MENLAPTACPSNKVAAFFQNPFANLDDGAADARLKEVKTPLSAPVPSERNGWLVALCTFAFMAFFALGPGICVWLALSELMSTTRIPLAWHEHCAARQRAEPVSTVIAAVFLPTVGKYGYSTMFFLFAGCTVVYFITAAFFLPETKGKTLEEIEEHFEGRKNS